MINTLSGWNYGHTIRLDNKYLNFEEDGATVNPKTAILLEGSYTLSEFAIEIARALNDESEVGNTYNVSVDRITRKLTITSDGTNFSLLVQSGNQSELSAFPLAGFSGLDLSGSNSYQGDLPSGSQFIPQFKLQDYTAFIDLQKTANASINENTKGDIVEVINYGNVNMMKCNIMFQTNITPQNAIREDAQGVEKLREFMQYLITKAKVEFMEDVQNSPELFTKCILDKTSTDRKGLGFELKDMKGVGWTNYFTTDIIDFREVL